jgi:hypothetical protein
MVLEAADRLAERLFRRRSAMFIQKQYNELFPLVSLAEDQRRTPLNPTQPTQRLTHDIDPLDPQTRTRPALESGVHVDNLIADHRRHDQGFQGLEPRAKAPSAP